MRKQPILAQFKSALNRVTSATECLGNKSTSQADNKPMAAVMEL